VGDHLLQYLLAQDDQPRNPLRPQPLAA